MNHFYERNNYILNHKINRKFEDILWMTEDEFRQWVIEMRETIVYAWDELGIPPSEVYYDYDNLKQRVDNAQSLSDEAKSKYREVTDYTGIGNFWN